MFTTEHRYLATAYRKTFMRPIYHWPELTLMQVHHRFTRAVYGYLLADVRLPFPSILSPHQAYSHPHAGVNIYLRPTNEYGGYFDAKIGDVTYVLEYRHSMCQL